jgi:hypothetical protein
MSIADDAAAYLRGYADKLAEYLMGIEFDWEEDTSAEAFEKQNRRVRHDEDSEGDS